LLVGSTAQKIGLAAFIGISNLVLSLEHYYFFIYPVKPLLAYGGNARMLCTGKTLWGRKPVGLGLSFIFCRYRVDVPIRMVPTPSILILSAAYLT
jgi:hypothetical protein